MGGWIIKRKHLLQIRPGRSKTTGKHQVSTGGVMTQNQAGGIIALAAQTQQILIYAPRQIQFAAVHMITRLPIGNLKELRGGAELLPQLSCAGVSLACFGRRLAFDSK